MSLKLLDRPVLRIWTAQRRWPKWHVLAGPYDPGNRSDLLMLGRVLADMDRGEIACALVISDSGRGVDVWRSNKGWLNQQQRRLVAAPERRRDDRS